MALTQLQLVQTQVSRNVLRQLDALARADEKSRSRYLASLIAMHVKAVSPKLLKSLNKTRPDPLQTSPRTPFSLMRKPHELP